VRALIYIPLAVIVVCGVAFACCAAVGWQPHPRGMLIAAATCLAAGLLAVMPLVVIRRTGAANAGNVAQAALIGTVIHLFVCIGVAAVVLLTKMPLGPAFTYWLAALYWTTLAGLAAGLIGEVRTVSAAAGTTQAQK
jgi:hypothetical protein